ncbi:XdhC family protein [Pseudocitrobacter faecalis]|uniref:XdhC family protein n=1 Tax=Pseudocitrobacter faecalis TaxID=1398493 RepID=UPI003BA096E1
MLQRLQCTPEQALRTDDPATILRFAVDSLESGMGVALVTLTDIHGGAARATGSQMAVREDGHYCGYVSGGCVEGAVAWEALEVIATGKDKSVRYGQGSPWFDIVLPCGGGITLTIHALRSSAPLRDVLGSLELRQSVALIYNSRVGQLEGIVPPQHTGWVAEKFVIAYHPTVRLILSGHHIEAEMTRQLARAAGYEVTDDPALMDTHSALILLWHDLDREQSLLAQSRLCRPFYIGALGSERTHQRRKALLRKWGWTETEIARITAPIGLIPKARDSRTLALSVLADVANARQGSGQ